MDPREILARAMASELGISVETDEVDKLAAKLRLTARHLGNRSLHVIRRPPRTIWLVKKEVFED